MDGRFFKLMRLRHDGSLGPLFINRRQVIPEGVWLQAESHPTPGFALRPGWHVTLTPHAPHLSTKGRIWCMVEAAGIRSFKRPECQGGTWYLADRMRVLHRLLL